MGALMPLYLKYQGLTTEQIGLTLALGAVIAVAGQPIFGYLSDKIQSTKKVLISVMVITLISSFVYFHVHSFLWIITLFVFLNFFQSPTGPLTENITIAYAKKHQKNYGVIRLWGDVGVGTAAVVLGILIGIFGVQYLGWMYAVIIIIAIILGFTLQDERRKITTPISVKSLKVLLVNKEYLWFLLLTLLLFITHRMNDSLFTVYLSELGASESQVGLAWMLATFASAPLFIISARLLKKYKELTLIIIAGALYSVRWLLYGLFDDPVALIYLQLLNGLTFPIFLVAGLFFVTKIVPEEITATGQTIFIAVIVGIAGLIGSGGGGWIMERFGAPSTYLLGAVITLFGTLLCIGTYMYQSNKLVSINNKVKSEGE